MNYKDSSDELTTKLGIFKALKVNIVDATDINLIDYMLTKLLPMRMFELSEMIENNDFNDRFLDHLVFASDTKTSLEVGGKTEVFAFPDKALAFPDNGIINVSKVNGSWSITLPSLHVLEELINPESVDEYNSGITISRITEDTLYLSNGEFIGLAIFTVPMDQMIELFNVRDKLIMEFFIETTAQYKAEYKANRPKLMSSIFAIDESFNALTKEFSRFQELKESLSIGKEIWDDEQQQFLDKITEWVNKNRS